MVCCSPLKPIKGGKHPGSRLNLLLTLGILIETSISNSGWLYLPFRCFTNTHPPPVNNPPPPPTLTLALYYTIFLHILSTFSLHYYPHRIDSGSKYYRPQKIILPLFIFWTFRDHKGLSWTSLPSGTHKTYGRISGQPIWNHTGPSSDSHRVLIYHWHRWSHTCYIIVYM